MASKEIKGVNDSDGKEENYQRQLTLLNEAVDGSCNFFPVLSGPFPTPGLLIDLRYIFEGTSS